MRIPCRVGAALLLALVPLAAAMAAENLVQDPSFEAPKEKDQDRKSVV